MDPWMDPWMDGWMHPWMDGCSSHMLQVVGTKDVVLFAPSDRDQLLIDRTGDRHEFK